MLTFTLTVVIALLGLIGLAVGYWLGYRTGYTDGVEDALGTEDKWTPLQEGNAPYGLSGGYTADSIRSGTLPDGWPSRERVDAALADAERKGWEPGKVTWIDTKATEDSSAMQHPKAMSSKEGLKRADRIWNDAVRGQAKAGDHTQ